MKIGKWNSPKVDDTKGFILQKQVLRRRLRRLKLLANFRSLRSDFFYPSTPIYGRPSGSSSPLAPRPRPKGAFINDVHNIFGFLDPLSPLCLKSMYCLFANFWYFWPPLCADVIYGSPSPILLSTGSIKRETKNPDGTLSLLLQQKTDKPWSSW